MSKRNYEVISEFVCCGRQMVTVKLKNGTHVMPLDEWNRVYGKLHPERWKNKHVGKNKNIA